mmetsp:Transcript_14167/g.43407  ORF Transcript_14167/g.43407 Transcript_14167/m.43407 type:complete len:120 (-) Transcript_14167:360-719(-)|eukprot:scaffold104390_cov31-Tisochrysis_lutea.AAC.2
MKRWHDEFGPKLEILLFPSDEWRQELPTEEIPHAVQSHGLPIDAPGCHLMDKVSTNGPKANEVFKIAKISYPGDITWNFDGAFVFGADGSPMGKFSLRGDLAYADRLVRRAVATTAIGM